MIISFAPRGVIVFVFVFAFGFGFVDIPKNTDGFESQIPNRFFLSCESTEANIDRNVC